MKNRSVIIYLKALILLSPIPFGCVGRIFSPLFYILLLVLSIVALGQVEKQVHILHEKKIRYFFYAFLGFLAWQMIPLPLFLLKIFSPGTVHSLTQLKDQVPTFHPISMVPLETVVFAFKFLVFALFFWVMIRVKFEKKDIISILKILMLSSVLQVFLGFLKYLQGNRLFFLFFYEDSNVSLIKFLTGTLGNADHFAFYLEMILPLFLALFFLKLQFLEAGQSLREKFLSVLDENKGVMVYFAGPVFLGAGIILTGSRSGIITMIFSFLIFGQLSFYLKQRKSLRKKLKFFFIGITALVLFIGVQSTMDKFLSTRIENAGRFLRWPATMTMAQDFPIFGTGFGTYRYAYFLYDLDEGGKWSTHAHNDYLEAAAEGGIIGSVLFFLLIGMVIYSIVSMWGYRKHPEVKMIGIGIITSLFAAAFHSIFDFSLHIPSNVFVFVLILVLGIKLVTYKREFKE